MNLSRLKTCWIYCQVLGFRLIMVTDKVPIKLQSTCLCKIISIVVSDKILSFYSNSQYLYGVWNCARIIVYPYCTEINKLFHVICGNFGSKLQLYYAYSCKLERDNRKITRFTVILHVNRNVSR